MSIEEMHDALRILSEREYLLMDELLAVTDEKKV